MKCELLVVRVFVRKVRDARVNMWDDHHILFVHFTRIPTTMYKTCLFIAVILME